MVPVIRCRPLATAATDIAASRDTVVKNGHPSNGSKGSRVAVAHGEAGARAWAVSGMGWRACQAVSSDLIHWRKNGPILQLGAAGEVDA